MGCHIFHFYLTQNEVKQIEKLLSVLTNGKAKIDLQPLLREISVWSHELPLRLRKMFYEFKMTQSSEVLIVKGYKVKQSLIGKTPNKHREAGEKEEVNHYEILHILFASLLGEVFGWTTIQNGYIINDIMPVFNHRELIASSGFDNTFGLHTEDAFHPCAGDYLGLMCLRNPQNIKSTFSSVSHFDLSEKNIAVLFEPRYIIGANVAQNVPEITEPSPIFFGNPNSPYLRVNLNSTTAISNDTEAENALESLKNSLIKNSVKVGFKPGDFCYIDNYRAVHGRDSFAPNFNGKDRWLKRLYITSSFRNSLNFRTNPEDRIIDPCAVNWKWNI